MSLFGIYVQETMGFDIIENEKGFITYKFLENDDCYVDHLFIHPGFRQSGEGTALGLQITTLAKDAGCKRLVANVNTKFKYPTQAIKAFLAFGFKIDFAIKDFICISKEI